MAVDLSDIDISNNTKLKILLFRISSLDISVSHLADLEELNLILSTEEIDLSANPKLKSVSISAEKLKSIDLSAALQLESLSLNTKVPSLDLSNNIKIKHLNISRLYHSDLDDMDNKQPILLGNVNLPDVVSLETLNAIIANPTEVLRHTELKNLYVNFVEAPEQFDLSQQLDLEKLRIRNTGHINIEQNLKLKELYIYQASLEELNLENHLSLETIWLENVSLTANEFTLTELPYVQLVYINIMDINNGVFEVSHLPFLETLRVYSMDFSNLVMSDLDNIGSSEVIQTAPLACENMLVDENIKKVSLAIVYCEE